MVFKNGTEVVVIRYMDNEDYIVGHAKVKSYQRNNGTCSYEIEEFISCNSFEPKYGIKPQFFTTDKSDDWRIENGKIRSRRYNPY